MFMKRSVSTIVIISMLAVFMSGCSGGENPVPVAETPVQTAEQPVETFVPEPQPTLEIREESFNLGPENLSANLDGCTIRFSQFDLDVDTNLTISTVQPDPYHEELDHNYRATVYDFELEGVDQFTDLIEITIPYDDSYMEPDADESRSAFGMYLNESTGEWETVNYSVDTESNTVTIITDHLSK